MNLSSDMAPWLTPITLAYGERKFRILSLDQPDHITEEIRRSGRFYEEDTLELLRPLVPAGSLVIDAGANLGNHTLFFAGVMNARVISVEPQKNLATLIRNSMALNGLEEQVTVYDCALGGAPGEAVLQVRSETNAGMTTTGPAGPDDPAEKRVPVRTLDTLVSEEEDVSLLKIDVEGGEVAVLQGAARLLERARPVLCVECADHQARVALETLLSEAGYLPLGSFGYTPAVVLMHRERFDADSASDIGWAGVTGAVKAFEAKLECARIREDYRLFRLGLGPMRTPIRYLGALRAARQRRNGK